MRKPAHVEQLEAWKMRRNVKVYVAERLLSGHEVCPILLNFVESLEKVPQQEYLKDDALTSES